MVEETEMKKLTTPELEVLVADFFNVRTKIIVPNVYWGMKLNYEVDLFVLTRSRYAYEVELKVSKSDLKKDMSKKHNHCGTYFKRLYFAMPENIYDEKLVPENAGVLLAYYEKGYTTPNGEVLCWELKEVRKPKEKKVKPLTDKEYLKILELMAMRIWTMKKKYLKLSKK